MGAKTKKNVQYYEKCSWIYAKGNSLGEHAVLLLTFPVLLPRAPGDFLLQGLQKGKKHLVPHYAVSVLTVQCMVFMYAYGNNSDPSFLIKICNRNSQNTHSEITRLKSSML